jgi:hypothetical protein
MTILVNIELEIMKKIEALFLKFGNLIVKKRIPRMQKIARSFSAVNISIHGSPNRGRIPLGPPSCIMRPPVTFVGYACTTKLKSNLAS